MKKVIVRYFAHLREALRLREESLSLPETATLQTLVALLRERHPEVQARLERCQFTRHGLTLNPDDPIHEGEVINVFPPLAGG